MMKREFLAAVMVLAAAAVIPEARAVKCVFNDPEFSFQCLRTLGYAVYGGADIGECLSTAARIPDGDLEAWYREWHAAARRLEQVADGFLAAGQKQSARECFLRASNYHRNSEFYLHINPSDPRILEAWRASRDCFLKAAELSGGLVRPVQIPYEGTTLPAYFCLADLSGARRPLLIVGTGFDGTGEELVISFGAAAAARGWNLLAFEGPGQGAVIREQRIPFRPDWEAVVTPMVDFTIGQPEVDPERIALLGISFGGYLCPRAAAFEPRIKALIANGGVYDFYANFIRQAPTNLEEILSTPEGCTGFDEDVREEMEKSVTLKWVFGNGMWVFGVKTPSELFKAVKPYTMKDCIGRIACPTLVLDGDADKDMPGQSRMFYEALACPKDFLLFRDADGAGAHCQCGALTISNARIFEWLDRTLGRRASSP